MSMWIIVYLAGVGIGLPGIVILSYREALKRYKDLKDLSYTRATIQSKTTDTFLVTMLCSFIILLVWPVCVVAFPFAMAVVYALDWLSEKFWAKIDKDSSKVK